MCYLQIEEDDPSLLVSTGEATPEVPSPGLGSLVQERYGLSGANPMKGHTPD